LNDSAFERPDDATRTRQRAQWGVPDGAIAVGIVARLAPVKNHALLIKAAVQLGSHCHVVVVGGGPLEHELRELARGLGVAHRVHFAGEVVGSANLHHFFDVSVLCSRSEGFPNSLIEACAAGRPVVATPVGGVVDVVQDGVNGLFVSDDVDSLATALSRLEADADLRARLGSAGQRSVRIKYSRDSTIDLLLEVYASLASPRDRATAATV
jgi:glycosyltransferase involved in cell wall biosynthesis